MKKNRWFSLLSVVIIAGVVSACGNNAAGGTNTAPQETASVAPGNTAESASPGAEATPSDAAASPAPSDEGKTETKGDGESSASARPDYLPADFPIPDDAVIINSTENIDNGKKSVLLVFKTKEGFDKLGQSYKDYVNEKKLEDGAQTIDDKNIIIQGTISGSEFISIIGGKLASEEGVSELTVSWTEQ
ncbi:hypothetical protein BBD42_30595 [Paenibacillus sp. BIHB 4019]|uniref:Lipoprotein n=1 Tax=Paenibacillus sp. BIHB 4019 TaxID=1870819 RepID=A0A1B2DRM0_9BACL|nr:hypothetical protein [Paenibacillus sp. BIHB 4019]ANY70364.1 hypothetical protein BBD42_30595 [Paenibacillus sp. BIHB 4019]